MLGQCKQWSAIRLGWALLIAYALLRANSVWASQALTAVNRILNDDAESFSPEHLNEGLTLVTALVNNRESQLADRGKHEIPEGLENDDVEDEGGFTALLNNAVIEPYLSIESPALFASVLSATGVAIPKSVAIAATVETVAVLGSTAAASTAVASTVSIVTTLTATGLGGLTLHLFSQPQNLSLPQYELKSVTMWAGYPSGQPADSDYFNNMLNQINDFNSQSVFKIDVVNAYISTPDLDASDLKWQELFAVDNFRQTVKTFYDNSIQLNVIIDHSSFNKGYNASSTVKLPEKNEKNDLSDNWKSGNDALIVPIDSALQWFYELQSSLVTNYPSMTINTQLIVDPEGQDGGVAHQEYQGLMMYIDEFRRENVINGSEPFETGVTLGVNSWKQAYGLVTEYPLTIPSEMQPAIKNQAQFIKIYNQGVQGLDTNNQINYDANTHQVTLTYQNALSSGPITDQVYMQIYDKGDFEKWLPSSATAVDEWYKLNYALRNTPYVEYQDQITFKSVADGENEDDITYSAVTFETQFPDEWHLGLSGEVILSQTPLNFSPQNAGANFIDPTLGIKAIISPYLTQNDPNNDNEFTLYMTKNPSLNSLADDDKLYVYTTEIGIKPAYPPPITHDDKTKLEWMFSMEPSFLGEHQMSASEFENYVEMFVNQSKSSNNNTYDPFGYNTFLSDFLVTQGDAIDNVAVYDYGELIDQGLWFT